MVFPGEPIYFAILTGPSLWFSKEAPSLEIKRDYRNNVTHHSIGHEVMPLQPAAAVVFPVKFLHFRDIVLKLKKKTNTCISSSVNAIWPQPVFQGVTK